MSEARHARPARPAVSLRVLYLAGVVAIAEVGGMVLGALVSSQVPFVLVLGALVAPPVLVATVLKPDFGLLVLVFLVYTRFSDVAIEFHGAPSVLQPYLLLLLLASAFRCVWTRQPPTGLGVPLAVIGTYGLVLSLSLIFAPDFEVAVEAVSTFLKDAFIAVLVLVLLRTVRTFQGVIWTLVLTGLFLGTLGTYQYVTGSFGQEFGGFAQASVKNIAEGTEDYRISGPLTDPNHYAQALLVILPLAVGRLRFGVRLVSRVTAFVAVAVLTLSLFFTFSRAALVVMAMVAVVGIVQRPPPLKALAVVAAGAVLMLPLLPPGYLDRVGQLVDALPGVGQGRTSEPSLSGRLSALEAGTRMALDNPVLGVGVDHFPLRYREYAIGLGIDTTRGAIEPHNLYIQVSAETGYVGLAAFTGLIVVVTRRLLRGERQLRQAGQQSLAHLVADLQLSLLAYLLAGLFVHNAYPRFFWLLLGICFAIPQVVEHALRREAPHEAQPSTSVPVPA